jgi:4-hydroxy-3-polyprenylbenzoate decarboxylase
LSIFSPKDFNVPFVSGSAKIDSMVILPCSMGTLGRIANGISNDSITRAADVFLKEKRQLILVPRESPLNLIQLRNMTTLAEAGAMILPAMPSFYGNQKTLEDVTATVVARVFDHLKLDQDLTKRWKEKNK